MLQLPRTRSPGRLLLALCGLASGLFAHAAPAPFRVIAFYTGTSDKAHVSFVREANQWFPKAGAENGFTYEATTNWTRLTRQILSQFQVTVFLDTRPDAADQRAAFRDYMEHGGAWMGFHFAAFALTPSQFPQNWDWYHEQFLGSGEYKGNTWRPTAAVLRVEKPGHPALKDLPPAFTASPNEWYSWKNDLRTNSAIEVLLSIHPSSFPLGTGPKPHEIWHEGDFPVAWTHRKYRMIYVNMGHNDLDYEHPPARELSATFTNAVQNRFVLDSLRWLGRPARE